MQDDALLHRPVFIIGSSRSGTAILAEILRAHPAVGYVREPRLVWRYGNDARSDLLRPDDARPDVVRHVRDRFAREVRAQGRHRLLEKTPSNALRIEFVDRIFPDGVFIHMLRDPVDCIAGIMDKWLHEARGVATARKRDRLRRHVREASWRQFPRYAGEGVRHLVPRRLGAEASLRPWGPRIPGMATLVKDLDLVDVCSLQWRMCTEEAVRAGRALGPERYVECRVESLSPEVLAQVLRLCDLDHPDVWRRYEEAYDPAAVTRRSEALSDVERARIEQWTAPTVTWLGAGAPGYPPSGDLSFSRGQ